MRATFRTLSKSLFTDHSTIRTYVWATDYVFKCTTSK
jgi:hypothetical protein